MIDNDYSPEHRFEDNNCKNSNIELFTSTGKRIEPFGTWKSRECGPRSKLLQSVGGI